MTREQFLADHRHTLAGVLMEGVIRGKDNAELGLFMRLMYAKIDATLGVLYDAAFPPKPVVTATNGVHKREGVK